jgi:hypothetical protein
LPVSLLPSTALALRPRRHRSGAAVEALARALRLLPIPVIGRIEAGRVLLDLRCLEDEANFVVQLESFAEYSQANLPVVPRRPGGEGRVRGADEPIRDGAHLTLPSCSLSSGRASRGPVGDGSIPLPPEGRRGARRDDNDERADPAAPESKS